MKKINFVKYGFSRFPEKDFSDDGSRFTCYRFSNTDSYATKHVSDGRIYLSSRIYGSLPFDIYSTLPHYNTASWEYNGVLLSTLTEEDIQKFFNACVEFEKEYRNAEATITYPTIEEITEQCEKIRAKRAAELKEINQRLEGHTTVMAAMKFSEFEWKTLHQYIRGLVANYKAANVEPMKIYGTVTSFAIVKPDYPALKDSFYYTSAMELINKKFAK